MLVCDFLLLITSLGLHWWMPVWGVVTDRFLLVLLIGLSFAFALLNIFRLRVHAKLYRRKGYTLKIARELIVSVESLTLLLLCGSWGLLILAGQPAVLALKLLGCVWVSGFLLLLDCRFIICGVPEGEAYYKVRLS